MGKAPRMTEDTIARIASTLEVDVGAHAAFTASRALTDRRTEGCVLRSAVGGTGSR